MPRYISFNLPVAQRSYIVLSEEPQVAGLEYQFAATRVHMFRTSIIIYSRCKRETNAFATN